MTRSRCTLGLAPEDVAAWAADGEPVCGVDDMEVHVAACDACAAVVASVRPSAELARALRAG
ncbi:MAG: hypothetical protein H0V19_00410, partial [Euzebyales bacterium]|nr:hypothetical protein [Euzebyales bacterium]